MTISDNTVKLLWGRAAGICSNPHCREDVTVLVQGNRSFNVGEMAHVIAKSPAGPRGELGGGSDEYENLILLCPTCHRKIDKAPQGIYSEELLHRWKDSHEQEIRAVGKNLSFSSSQDLKVFVARILAENKALWSRLGPRSEAAKDPGSNLYEVWALRKIDKIVPNNMKIINTVESNINLLNSKEAEAFSEFKVHAYAFEQNQYQRVDSYPGFPLHFEELMRS
jgi:HNH endonuclease